MSLNTAIMGLTGTDQIGVLYMGRTIRPFKNGHGTVSAVSCQLYFLIFHHGRQFTFKLFFFHSARPQHNVRVSNGHLDIKASSTNVLFDFICFMWFELYVRPVLCLYIFTYFYTLPDDNRTASNKKIMMHQCVFAVKTQQKVSSNT